MRARQLEVFCAVMRAGTVTAAARELNISQPALSQILIHTEDELKLKLFERVKGRLHPTPEARELFPEAERIFAGLDALRRRTADMRQGRVGLVRLAASAPPAMSFVPAALKAFRAACPNVAVRSHVAPVASLVRMVQDGDAGIAVAMDDAPQRELEVEVLGEVPLVCLAPADHPLMKRAEIGMHDLETETLISYRHATLPGRKLSRVAAEADRPFAPEIEIDASISALSFVQQGLGVAIVDGLLPWRGFPGVGVRPFAPTTVLPVAILTRRGERLSAPHRLLFDELRRAFAGRSGA